MIIGIVIAAIVIIAIGYFRLLVVVSPTEAHVISTGKKIKIFDGQGRYLFYSLWQERVIVPKHVFEITRKVRLHDAGNLPFAVEIACKVRVSDARAAVENLGLVDDEIIKRIVDDTIVAAARSASMRKDLITLMRNRDEVEQEIYASTADTMAKIGVTVVIFDITDFLDVKDSGVIKDLERVQSARVKADARESEAAANARAEIQEARKHAEAEVQRQEAIRARETARLQQEMQVADQQKDLTLKQMEVENISQRRQAEIMAERITIEAEAEAEKLRRTAQGQADAILLRAEAESKALQMKMIAEAEGTKELAKALQEFNDAGISIKLAEINSEVSKDVAKSIATALERNSKVFLPVGNGGLSEAIVSLVPGLEAFKEADVNLKEIIAGKGKKK
ncbi:MAG: SPFH domain-containing protein [Candidatus Kariarchaeaceae archaeon]